MASSERVAEARSTLRVALQVAAEAHADGLLSPSELRETVAELRGTYGATLAALGVDAASLPDPADSSDGGDGPYDDEYDEYDDGDPRQPGAAPRPPGSVASYTTLGSGFTAQTSGTVMSRLAQRLEQQRKAPAAPPANTAYPAAPQPPAAAAPPAQDAPRPGSRAAGLRREGRAPTGGAPASPYDAPPPPEPRSSAGGGARGRPLPPVAEEARGRGGGSTGSGGSSGNGRQRTSAPAPAPAPPATARGMTTAEAMAAHVAAMHAAAAQMQGAPAPFAGNEAAPLAPRNAAEAAIAARRERENAAAVRPLSPPPPAAAPRGVPMALAPPAKGFLPQGKPMPLAPPGSPPPPPVRARRRGAFDADDDPSDDDVALDEDSSGVDDGTDLETGGSKGGRRGGRGASPPPAEERRCLGFRLPRPAAPPPSRPRGSDAVLWPAPRVAAMLLTMLRISAAGAVASGVPAIYYSVGAKRLYATLITSFLAGLGAHSAAYAGARKASTALLLAGIACIMLNATAAAPFAATEAERLTLACFLNAVPRDQRVACERISAARGATHVYAWWCVAAAAPVLATAALLAARSEATEAAVRAVIAARATQAQSPKARA